jgi:hypothetical protein
MADNEWPPVSILSVIAAGIVAFVYACGWALPKIFHAFAEMVGLIAHASTISVMTAAPIAAWVAPVASAGVAALGAGTIIVVLVKAAKEAARNPYEWTVPLLGILGGLWLDLAKGYGPNSEFLKAVLTAVVAFLVVIAGACWKKDGWWWKTFAVILLLLPPATLLIQTLEISGTQQIMQSIRDVPNIVWLRLAGFVFIGVAIMILHTLDERSVFGRYHR